MLQLSSLSTAFPASTARCNISFEDILAQVCKENPDDDETVTDTICKVVNALQAVVAETAPVGYTKITDHVLCRVTPADQSANDADSDDVAGDRSKKVLRSSINDFVYN